MKAIWTAPYKHISSIEKWGWPTQTSFEEWYYFPPTWNNFDFNIWYPNPSQNFVIDRSVLSHMPALELIVTPSTGLNHIDLEACKDHDITVRGLLDDRKHLGFIRASSEFAFLMVLNSLRRYDRAHIVDGVWTRSDDDLRGHELFGKTVGLIGHGRIGRNLHTWCEIFGADVMCYDPYVIDTGGHQTSIETVFSESDIVVIACELTPETRCMVGVRLLTTMRRGARLVNIARGEIIDEVGLVSTLRARPDLTFVSDVITGEVDDTHRRAEILSLPNAVITPHIGGTTYESQEKAARIAMGLAKEYLDGKR